MFLRFFRLFWAFFGFTTCSELNVSLLGANVAVEMGVVVEMGAPPRPLPRVKHTPAALTLEEEDNGYHHCYAHRDIFGPNINVCYQEYWLSAIRTEWTFRDGHPGHTGTSLLLPWPTWSFCTP